MENDAAGDAERGDENIPYIDRLVREVEDNGGGVIGMDDEGDNWNLVDEENDDPSDDEMEWDSDEDSIMLVEDYEPKKNTGTLSELAKSLLLWRLDKEESFSDWVIEVSVVNEGGERNKTLYHVHKSALGAGPKKSGYFQALFQSGQFSESTESKSAVELPAEVAAVFPAFLDYIYSPPSECDCLIKRDNWRSLRYLANYFMIPGLTKAVHSFIEEDMHNIDRIEGYLSEFPAAEDDESKEIHSIAARVCTEMILYIKEDSSLLKALTPAIALHVFSAVRSRAKSLPSDKQRRICLLALVYIKKHHKELGRNYFAAIAQNLYFPDDTDDAGYIAIRLLEHMTRAAWEDGSTTPIYTAALSRYLATKDLSISKISELSKKLPKESLAVLFRESMAKQNLPQMKRKNINNVSCKIMNTSFGKPVGSIVKVSIKSFDSVNYIRYLICRELDLAGCADHRISVYFGEKKLENEASVLDCGVRSNSVLEIRYAM